jgi:hypothetical protein
METKIASSNKFQGRGRNLMNSFLMTEKDNSCDSMNNGVPSNVFSTSDSTTSLKLMGQVCVQPETRKTGLTVQYKVM